MKIIAEIPKGYGDKSFVIEATETELANYLGYYYKDEYEVQKRLHVGVNIEISPIYRQLKELSSAQDKLKTASQTLHSIANLVLIMDPLIDEVVNGKKENKEATNAG